MRAFFIFDVESIGLHGEGFAVGGGVYLENGAAQHEFRYSCPPDTAEGQKEGREWVRMHVPIFADTHRNPSGVREAFWKEWMSAKQRYREITMAAECGWPVEARFLTACVDDMPNERAWTGPYPLHEIASFMAIAGMDLMKPYERQPSELPVHDPLPDARLSARLFAEANRLIGPIKSEPQIV